MTIAGFVVSAIFNVIVPGLQDQYMNEAIFRAPDEPLMMLFLLYPFVTAIIMAWLWDKSKSVVKGKDVWTRGLNFGVAIGLLLTLPAFVINYSSFNLPFVMILSWTVMSFVNSIIAGLIIVKMNK